MNTHPVILFDGYCKLCDGSVQFIIKNNPKKIFSFASLQSHYGQQIIKKYGIPANMNSFILLSDGRIYYRSTAALRVLKLCQPPLNLLYGFIIVPPFIRNLVYDFIARNRFRWFGKKQSCMRPDLEMLERFIDY